jgi:hypothetical protein
LSPPNPFEGLKPDELHFEEASGNAGVSFERRYRRAALVVWPNDLALAVLTQAGLRVTVPHLGDLARRWVEAGAAPESPVRAEACDLAGHMIERWQQARTGSETEESDVARMLTALTALGDTDHIAAMVTQVLAVRDDYTKRDNAALAAALALFQAEQAAALVRILVTAKADTKFGACASLLAQPFVVGLSDQAEVREAAATLLAAVPRRAAGEPAPPFPGFNRDTVNASFVADLLLGLGAIDPALADRAATLILNHPLTFEVDAILVPAARDRLSAPEAARQPAVARVRAACLAHLRARIALPLAPPADWRRPSALNCKCPDCADLTRFLEDPTRSQWTLRAAAPARSHVETTILNSKVDLKATTDQRGRPYTLVCTKTQASYEARVAQRARDVRDAAILAG